MDPTEKQELKDSLKQSSYKISKKVEAEKDSFRIVISSAGIEQYYKNMPIITVKAEDLSPKALELINKNPEIAATTLLDQFAQEFDTNSFEKKAASGLDIKTAANETLDEMTWQMITQKQLDDQKTKMHPRQDEYPTTVTQKQIPEAGMRPGTFEITTEGQLRDERSTFYGTARVAGDWKDEDRNVVTEGQLDKGAKEYSDLGQSDRGEMGAKYDGGPQQQARQIGEKQLAELLKHHKWTEPFTTTEGKDQLAKQEGELSRITAEIAEKIIKESLNALGKTVLAAGITPIDLTRIVSTLVSHESKYPVLANVIRSFAGSDVSAIDRKVAKAKHFGKVANAGIEWSDELVADAVVRQLAKMSYNPAFIVEGLASLAENASDFTDRIIVATDEALKAITETKTASTSKSIFKQVLAGETNKPKVVGDDADGLYAYHGVVSEVLADVNNEEEFNTAAAQYAMKQIIASTGKQIDLVQPEVSLDKNAGTFSVKLQKADSLQARADARRQLVKESQMGGMGGMGAPAGDPMANPAPPAGAADMGAPPAGESLTQEPPLPEEEEAGGSGEPKPPGTVCAACGSEDVDLDNGALRCNNCGAEGTISVHMQWDKWPGTLDDTEGEQEGGFGLGNEVESGLESPEEEAAAEGGATMPNIPVGASIKITPFMVEKLAAQNIRLGSVCPNCGSKETDSIKSAGRGNDGICWECGQDYHTTLKAIKGKRNSVVAETIWVPKSANAATCSKCTKTHKAFVKSLKNYGMNWDQFDRLAMKEQAQVVIKMANSGTLDIESAINAPLPIHRYAASTKTDKFDKFPSASCRERLARRFGENATAMSGPCQGSKLCDCVCDQLENLGIYSDGLAAKVASVQASKDPMINNPVETCVKMLANEGISLKEACVACDGLRAAYASTEDLIIETIAQSAPASGFLAPKPMMSSPKPMRSSPGGGMPNTSAPGGAMSQPAAKTKPMMAPGKPMMGGPKPMMGGPKPMPGVDDPMSEPVSDLGGMGGDVELDFEGEINGAPIEGDMDTGMNGLGGGMAGGMGGDMGGLGGGLGELGGMEQNEQPDTVSLLADIANDFAQLAKALTGNIGDDMIEPGMEEDGFGGEEDGFGEEEGEGDGFGSEDLDESLDVSDVTEDDDDGGGDDGGGDGGNPFGGGEEDSEESGIPGVEESDDGGLEKESKPCNSKPCNKPNQEKREMTPHASEQRSIKKEASSEQSPEQRELDSLLFSMKRGTIKKSSEALDSVFDSLLKIAAKAKNDEKKVEYKSGGEGSKIKATPAQDSKDIGTISKGGKIGHEEPFSKGVKTKPDVPRAKALMGDEGDEMTISETGDLPTVPHGSPLMEGEEHFKPEKGNVVDGNQGATKAASKTAACKCKCGDPECKCKCGKGTCGKPCNKSMGKKCSSKQTTKEAQFDAQPGQDPQTSAVAEQSDIDPVNTAVDIEPEIPGTRAGDVTEFEGQELDPGFAKLMDRAVEAYKQVHPEDDATDIATFLGGLMPKRAAEIDTYFRQHPEHGELNIPSGAGDRFGDLGGEEGSFEQEPELSVAQSNKESIMKVAKVNPTHKIYGKLVQKIASGQQSVTLTDGNLYQMSIDEKKNVILAQKIKVSQTVSPKSVQKLEDDPDINQSSGPGKGKVKEDKTHSLAVDEKKPSEGMSEPSVPEAPNGGRLQREHTVEKAKDGPEIPAGGGTNPAYDTVEKYAPEKLDETLGKDGGMGATAENHELAVKIAGKLLKANKITVDELPKAIDELSKKTVAEILDTFEAATRGAETKQGIQKTANTVENLPLTTNVSSNGGKDNLVSDIKSLFTLDKRNDDYNRYSQEREAKLWR